MQNGCSFRVKTASKFRADIPLQPACMNLPLQISNPRCGFQRMILSIFDAESVSMMERSAIVRISPIEIGQIRDRKAANFSTAVQFLTALPVCT